MTTTIQSAAYDLIAWRDQQIEQALAEMLGPNPLAKAHRLTRQQGPHQTVFLIDGVPRLRVAERVDLQGDRAVMSLSLELITPIAFQEAA